MISSLIVVQLSLSSLMAQIFAQEGGGGGYLQYILCVWIILNFKNFCKVKSINSFSDYLKMIKKKKKKKKNYPLNFRNGGYHSGKYKTFCKIIIIWIPYPKIQKIANIYMKISINMHTFPAISIKCHVLS